MPQDDHQQRHRCDQTPLQKFGHKESVIDAYNKRYGKKTGPWRVKNTKTQVEENNSHVEERKHAFDRAFGVISADMATVGFATASTAFLDRIFLFRVSFQYLFVGPFEENPR